MENVCLDDGPMPDEAFEDATVIMEALLDIPARTRNTSSGCSRRMMGKKKQRTPEERAAWKARRADLDRRLREAIERRKAQAARRRAGEA